jgi:hypothetical protein
MRLFVDVKPSKKVAKTKADISVGGIPVTWGDYPRYSKGANCDTYSVYGVNYEKHRKKVVDGKLVAGHWVGYVYKFPKDLLHGLGLCVVQDKRNFRLEKMK